MFVLESCLRADAVGKRSQRGVLYVYLPTTLSEGKGKDDQNC